MAIIEITQEDIKKMIKDQLGCDNVMFDDLGNAHVKIDLDKIKKQMSSISTTSAYGSGWRLTNTSASDNTVLCSTGTSLVYGDLTTNNTSSNEIR